MRALLLIATLSVSAACARDPLVGPSPVSGTPIVSTGTTVVITAQVLEARTEHPIPDAIVFVDSINTGSTDEAGTFTTRAEPGREFTMSASADGYHPSVTVAGTAPATPPATTPATPGTPPQ